MSSNVVDAIQKVALVLLGFSLGFFNPVIARWWKRRHGADDAKRLFRRELETLLGPFEAIRIHFERKNGLLDSIGPSIFKGTIAKLTASLDSFETKNTSLLDLLDDDLERDLTKFYEQVAWSRDQLEQFARPWYPDNVQPGMVWGQPLAYQQFEMFRMGAEAQLNNAKVLIKRLRALKHGSN